VPLTSLRTAPSELAIFYSELGKLLVAGLPLAECFEILQQGIESDQFQKSIIQLRELANEGNSLAECFAKTPQIANQIIVRLLENSPSNLEINSILQALAEELAQTDAIREVKERVYFWPVVYLAVAAVVAAVLSIFVMPSIASFYDSMHATLPVPTQVLLMMGWEVTVVCGVLIASLIWLYKRPSSRIRVLIDAGILHLPLMGGLSRKIAITQYLRMLSSLLLRKIPYAEAIVLAAESVDNQALAAQLAKAAATPGNDLLSALRVNPLIPKRFITAIEVGEKTQSMDDVLRFSVASYGDALINDMQRYQDSMELILKIVIGVAVAHIALAVYLPIFKMGSAI
jgi:type IV pilus assembly protein PilC